MQKGTKTEWALPLLLLFKFGQIFLSLIEGYMFMKHAVVSSSKLMRLKVHGYLEQGGVLY